MDNATPTTRRSVLQGLPLAAVAASIPLLAGHSVAAPASTSVDAHLFSLVEAWRAQYEECTVDRPPAEADAAYERLYATERELATVRPTTVEGYAAKLLILTSFGDFDFFDGRDKDALLAEAREIAAIAPPRSFIAQRDAIAQREALE